MWRAAQTTLYSGQCPPDQWALRREGDRSEILSVREQVWLYRRLIEHWTYSLLASGTISQEQASAALSTITWDKHLRLGRVLLFYMISIV